MPDVFRHGRVLVEDTTLHWAELGGDGAAASATPIVLLHGLTDSHLTWKSVAPLLARDRRVLGSASVALRNAAGNFYINDKPTGAVVGQQPFGGARGSGTNDKAGSKLNLVRWVSARTIKETFSPPREVSYPYMGEE